MIRVNSTDVDRDLTPKILLSWVNTVWIKKPIDTRESTAVSGGPFERNVFKIAVEIPLSQEIIDDMKWLTHDENVELARPLTDDQLALVLYRVANTMRQYEQEMDRMRKRMNVMRKTARKLFGKKTNIYDIADLLGIPTED